MLTPQQANAVVEYAREHNITNEEAAARLNIDIGVPGKPPEPNPWAKFVKPDSRIPMEKLADNLQRAAEETGKPISDVEALRQAIQMDGMAAAPLIAEETARYDERANAAAQREFFNTPDGIAALGRMRQAQANALKERADAMRPELAARGLPVESMSDSEVVGWVNEMAEKRAADAEANSLQANLNHIAAMDAKKGGEGQ
jgi:hypothetical protein